MKATKGAWTEPGWCGGDEGMGKDGKDQEQDEYVDLMTRRHQHLLIREAVEPYHVTSSKAMILSKQISIVG